jgi:hypothetical protein
MVVLGHFSSLFNGGEGLLGVSLGGINLTWPGAARIPSRARIPSQRHYSYLLRRNDNERQRLLYRDDGKRVFPRRNFVEVNSKRDDLFSDHCIYTSELCYGREEAWMK